jgi:pimeloyl-ACP methyl ester carboxylesterase
MLQLYASAHPEDDVEFTLIGHSLGGLVALHGVYDALSSGGMNYTIRAVITVDSPLRGSPIWDTESWPYIGDALGIENPMDCLNGRPIGELNEMDADQVGTLLWNQGFVQLAHAFNVQVHTLGNAQDCLYNPPFGCLPDDLQIAWSLETRLPATIGGDATDTQVLDLPGGDTADTSMLFSLGPDGFPNVLVWPWGHGAALRDPGIIAFIGQCIGSK